MRQHHDPLRTFMDDYAADVLLRRASHRRRAIDWWAVVGLVSILLSAVTMGYVLGAVVQWGLR